MFIIMTLRDLTSQENAIMRSVEVYTLVCLSVKFVSISAFDDNRDRIVLPHFHCKIFVLDRLNLS